MTTTDGRSHLRNRGRELVIPTQALVLRCQIELQVSSSGKNVHKTPVSNVPSSTVVLSTFGRSSPAARGSSSRERRLTQPLPASLTCLLPNQKPPSFLELVNRPPLSSLPTTSEPPAPGALVSIACLLPNTLSARALRIGGTLPSIVLPVPAPLSAPS